MDMPEIKLIKTMRKQLDWTQKDLADAAGVTQSMINKIERGTKMPSFETAGKLFNILSERIAKQSNKLGVARDISVKLVFFISPDQTVAEAIKKLGDNFDQLPVVEEEKCIGTISNKRIITLMDKENFQQKQIREVMEPPLPIIAEEEQLTKVRRLLELFDALLTTKDGKITGIITRTDLLKMQK